MSDPLADLASHSCERVRGNQPVDVRKSIRGGRGELDKEIRFESW
jgi:hypothetical protein